MVLLLSTNWFIASIIDGIIYGIYGLMFAIFSLLSFWMANYLYTKKIDDEINGEEYVAVVLTNKSFNDKIFIYFCGVMFLLMYLKKNKISYKVMKEFDIEKFKGFIYDPNCYGLYIIGHGIRHGLRISNNEILYYCSFKDAPKKEFVQQLHCNQYGGESLADIIASNKEKSFAPDGFRSVYANLSYFIHLYRLPLKK
ncbi:MAG: hypothetical protein ABOK23_02880 [Candidatus Methanoperedens sp.]|nr:hypothetical protein [Candidatus Methanoperedens sp.]MCZ7394789.1 hypothetical protein [Candidatus Methanoperedens sp.]